MVQKKAFADFLENLNAYVVSGVCEVIQFHENPSRGS
jgi:hypothetical protein